MNKKGKLSLAAQIFIALVAGIITGLLLIGNPEIATKYISPWGTLFLNLIKFVVVPVVLLSITAGVISMKDIRKVGSIGGKTVAYYFCTTAFAIMIGLLISNIFKGSYMLLSVSELAFEASEPPSFIDTIINMFPSNIVMPFANANMLQIIVGALFLGFGIILVGDKGKAATDVVESFNEVFIKIMDIIIKISPFGVFCLITPVVAVNGSSILGSLAMVLLTAYIGYIIHAVLVYSSTVKLMAGMSPVKFFKGMFPAILMAFSSASSVGTLPLNMECTEKLGARKDIISFTLPLGATINMDGTAIYQGVCSVFIATCYGITLTLDQMMIIVLTATLASIGTAGVPGSGMIMLAMVLESVGLPLEGIALVAGVDRLFDMGRTTVNITGDAACSIIVSKLEDKKDARKLAA